ncbi:MAG: VOC family protein [Candidatus Eremiobacteraeota bacterium]|nr:VOC family protein [Candidatus Eremiobacteraeota bacterium]
MRPAPRADPAESENERSVNFKRSIPILRIFDVDKAREFYLGYLGFSVDFEHRFHDGAPLFMGVSRDGLPLFLSEHHGDGSPGTYVRIDVTGIDELYAELAAKAYKYTNPSIVEQEWGQRELCVYDPFGNRLIFSEPVGA